MAVQPKVMADRQDEHEVNPTEADYMADMKPGQFTDTDPLFIEGEDDEDDLGDE